MSKDVIRDPFNDYIRNNPFNDYSGIGLDPPNLSLVFMTVFFCSVFIFPLGWPAVFSYLGLMAVSSFVIVIKKIARKTALNKHCNESLREAFKNLMLAVEEKRKKANV